MTSGVENWYVDKFIESHINEWRGNFRVMCKNDQFCFLVKHFPFRFSDNFFKNLPATVLNPNIVKNITSRFLLICSFIVVKYQNAYLEIIDDGIVEYWGIKGKKCLFHVEQNIEIDQFWIYNSSDNGHFFEM